jgi:hypothetical protein
MGFPDALPSDPRYIEKFAHTRHRTIRQSTFRASLYIGDISRVPSGLSAQGTRKENCWVDDQHRGEAARVGALKLMAIEPGSHLV